MKAKLTFKLEQAGGRKIVGKAERYLKNASEKVCKGFLKHYKKKNVIVETEHKPIKQGFEIIINFKKIGIYEINKTTIKEILKKEPNVLNVTKTAIQRLCEEMINIYKTKGLLISYKVEVFEN